MTNMTQSRIDDDTRQDALKLIAMALAEDLEGKVDCTTWATIPDSARGSAAFVSRKTGVVCGLEVAKLVVAQHGKDVKLETMAEDGDSVQPQQTLARISGSSREILTLERTCLNFMGRLSGIATLTNRFVQKTAKTRAKVLDTRKTTPGWRRLEKYAVKCGGGANHRMGLFDAILIKDNHIAMCGELVGKQKRSITEILEIANDWVDQNQKDLPHGRDTVIQLEVDNIEQLREALSCSVDIVLLDNMSTDQLEACVELRNKLAAKVLLEASGGVNLDTIEAISQTGVDRISVGALTHSATNFDIGLDWS